MVSFQTEKPEPFNFYYPILRQFSFVTKEVYNLSVFWFIFLFQITWKINIMTSVDDEFCAARWSIMHNSYIYY